MKWTCLILLITEVVTAQPECSSCNLTTTSQDDGTLQMRLACTGILNISIINGSDALDPPLNIYKDCKSDNCSITFNLCESTRDLCMNTNNTTEITTSDPPGSASSNSSSTTTTPFPITCPTFTDSPTSTDSPTCLTTCPECPTCQTISDQPNEVYSTVKPTHHPCTQTTAATINTTPTLLDTVTKVTYAVATLVGLLLLLLVVVIVGWMWTCWVLRKREGMTLNNSYSSPNTLEIINSTDYSDGTLKRLQNPLYETTPAEFSKIGSIPQTGLHSEGLEPTYEPITLSSNHPKKESRNSASGESMSPETLKIKRKVENQYYLLSKEETEEEGQAQREEEAKNQYHLLSNAKTNTTMNTTKESNVYHYAGREGDEDHEDRVVDRIENGYHILAGSKTESGDYDEIGNVYDIPVIKRN